MKFNHLQHTLAWAGLALSGWALADPTTEPPPATRVSHYAASYTVSADGTSVEQREWALAILQPEAVNGVSKTTVPYNEVAQKVEVIEAYTRKPDGRRIEVPKASQEDAADPDTGHRVLTVSFPEVAVGDTLVMAYRLSTSKPMFAAHFSIHESFPKSVAYDDVKIKVDVPAGLWTQAQARDLRQVQRLQKDGRQITEWAWDNKQPVQGAAPSLHGYEYEQDAGLMFSTWRNHGDLAKAYGLPAQAKAVATARVKDLAAQVVREAQAKAPRDVARALYDWVLANIANEGACLGLNDVLPRDVDTVLDKRVGDCKDHATLLQALLLARGIQSTQALINDGKQYGMAKVPVASEVNHVINYIPSLKLYLDSSSETTPFGMLPFGDQGKLVLLVDGYKADTRTPVAPVGANRQHMLTQVAIQADGTATGTVQVDLKGMFAVNARLRLRNLTKEQDANLVKGFFESTGLVGSGTLTKDEGAAWRDTYGYRTQFSVQQWLRRPGAGTFTIAPLFYSESPVADYLAAATQPVNGGVETSCSSGHSVEEYRYEFPPNMDIISVPRNVKLDSPTLSYSATYQLKGRVLSVKRVFDDRTVGNVCSPAAARAYQQFAAKAVPDATALVVFR